MTVVPMMKKSKSAPSALEKPYEPNNREVATEAAHRKRCKTLPPVPKMKIEMSQSEGKRVASIMVDHPDPGLGYLLLSEALGSESDAFLAGTLDALGKIAQIGDVVSEGQINYALSMVCGLRPRDQIEATLGVQMAAIHTAMMNAAASLGGAKTIEVQEGYERALNRLARTFAAQVEALKRYRSKGEQRVIVERVTVEKGGQAIVGNVAHGVG